MSDDADGARVGRGWAHETKHRIEEEPITVEEGATSGDQMLQDGEDVRKGNRVAGEGCQGGCCEVVEVIVIVATLVHHQCGKALLITDRICDAQLAVSAALVTADCQKGRLRRQSRDEANGVSDVRAATVRELACTRPVCHCQLGLTLNHGPFRRDTESRYGAHRYAHRGRKVDEIRGRNERMLEGDERTADAFESSTCLFLSFPSLCRS